MKIKENKLKLRINNSKILRANIFKTAITIAIILFLIFTPTIGISNSVASANITSSSANIDMPTNSEQSKEELEEEIKDQLEDIDFSSLDEILAGFS